VEEDKIADSIIALSEKRRRKKTGDVFVSREENSNGLNM